MSENIKTRAELLAELQQIQKELSRYQAAEEDYQRMIALLQKNAEEALRASAEKYRALFDSLQDVFFRTDTQGKIILTSPSVVQLLGYTQEEACQLNMERDLFVHPEQWKNLVRAIEENRSLEEIEVLMKRWDGSVVWCSTTSQWYTDQQGRILGVEGMFRDISKRKLAEEEIKQYAVFLRTLLDTIPGPVFYKDAHGCYQGCNTAFAEQILGIPKEQIIGLTIEDLSEIVPTDLAKIYTEYDRHLLQRSGTHMHEAPVKCADGKKRDFIFYKATFNGADNTVAGLVGVMLDITERKRQETLLKLNQERLEALITLHQMHDFSIEEIAEFTLEKAIDLTGSTLGFINYVSEEDDRVTPSIWSKAVHKRSITGKPEYFSIRNSTLWADVLQHKTPLIMNDVLPTTIAVGGALPKDLTIKRVLIVPVFDDNHLVLLSAVANKREPYDDTDRDELTLLMSGMWKHINDQLAAEELRKAKEHAETVNVQLRELNASKDTFFSIIAHDLRGPLSSLHELTQHIEENLDNYSQEELKELIVLQKGSAEALYKLLENLLTWSRVQRGALTYQPQPINIRWFITRNIDLLAVHARKKQITVSNVSQEESFVYADFNMIDTVIRNLLSNAIKFTPPGGAVTVTVGQDEYNVEIAVTDTGIGIEAEHLQDLFRIDVRYKRTGTAQEEGTGLGLILCKEFIEKHGGHIWVESQLGQGSTFRFTLPRVTENDIESLWRNESSS